MAAAVAGLAGAARRRLLQLAGRPGLSAAELAEARGLIRQSGAEAGLREREERLITAAHAGLRAFPDSEWRRLLAAWLDFVCERRF